MNALAMLNEPKAAGRSYEVEIEDRGNLKRLESCCKTTF
jgi:hypothetical protein